jgi:hypothetical protein
MGAKDQQGDQAYDQQFLHTYTEHLLSPALKLLPRASIPLALCVGLHATKSRFARGRVLSFCLVPVSLQLDILVVVARNALAKVADAFAQRSAELRQPLGPEDQQ